jgi:hypothetical protein
MKSVFSVLKLKTLIACFALTLLAAPVFAQVNMQFCHTVSPDNGAAEWPFNTITFVKDKPLKCVVYLSDAIPGLTYVTFKVQYRQNSEQPFVDKAFYKLDVQPDWLWFYYNLSFEMAGNYKVIILDNNDKPLTESMLYLVL